MEDLTKADFRRRDRFGFSHLHVRYLRNLALSQLIPGLATLVTFYVLFFTALTTGGVDHAYTITAPAFGICLLLGIWLWCRYKAPAGYPGSDIWSGRYPPYWMTAILTLGIIANL